VATLVAYPMATERWGLLIWTCPSCLHHVNQPVMTAQTGGDVPNELIADSESSPICQSMDKYANHQIRHLSGFGKTYGLPYQAFDPGTRRGVFAFDLLRM